MIDDVCVCKLEVEKANRPLLCSTTWLICKEDRTRVPRSAMQFHYHLSVKHKKLGVINRRLDSGLDDHQSPLAPGVARCKTLRHVRMMRDSPQRYEAVPDLGEHNIRATNGKPDVELFRQKKNIPYTPNTNFCFSLETKALAPHSLHHWQFAPKPIRRYEIKPTETLLSTRTMTSTKSTPLFHDFSRCLAKGKHTHTYIHTYIHARSSPQNHKPVPATTSSHRSAESRS